MKYSTLKCNPLQIKKKNANIWEHKIGIDANIANFVLIAKTRLCVSVTLCWPDQCCLTTRDFPDGGLPGRLPVHSVLQKPVVLFVSMDTCIDKCPQSGNSFFALSPITRGNECYISVSYHFISFT